MHDTEPTKSLNFRRSALAAAVATLLVGSAAGAATYTIRPQQSELVVRTYKAGIASALGHDHVARATRFSGTVEYDPQAPTSAAVELAVDAASVIVDERALRRRQGLDEEVSAKDRSKIQATMLGAEQLDVERFAAIVFHSTRVEPATNGGLEITGDFTLHGVTRQVTLPVTVELDGATLSAEGSFRLLQSDYGIEPFSGGFGTVRNQDEIELTVRVEARRSD